LSCCTWAPTSAASLSHVLPRCCTYCMRCKCARTCCY
jgi:hypothetical protein